MANCDSLPAMPVALAAAVQQSADVSVLDKWDFGLGIFGFLLTILGFGVALAQIRKTKRAVDAAADAVRIGTVRIRYNQLLVLAPQMQYLEGELDGAIQQDDHFGAERVLLRWRQLATSVHGILGPMGSEYATLVEDIDKTRSNAIATKGKISESRGAKRVATLVAVVHKEISSVNDTLGSVVGRLATEVPSEEGS